MPGQEYNSESVLIISVRILPAADVSVCLIYRLMEEVLMHAMTAINCMPMAAS